jgi:putative ABC transport system substrate-binding protein
MRRRHFLILSGIVLPCAGAEWPLRALAQTPGKTYRIGLLASRGGLDERMKALVHGLAERGFREGRNLVLELKSADGKVERLPGLAAEFVGSGVDAIVSFGYPAAAAAKQASTNVPIVVTGAGDPVATGLVEGLSRPGGNITGVTELSTELSAKRLELLKAAAPGVARVAMIWNAADLGMTLRYQAAEDAARVLGFKVQTLGVREPNDFDDAFEAMTRDRPDAILMVSDALTMLNRKRVVEFATANRLPTIYETAAPVRDGGLMSYGPSQTEIGERAADFVARILRGARPAEQPLEQPTKFELVINIRAAAALGVVVSPTLLARADEVIE